MSFSTFEVDREYKRSEIKQAIGLDPTAKGGPWDTAPSGLTRHWALRDRGDWPIATQRAGQFRPVSYCGAATLIVPEIFIACGER